MSKQFLQQLIDSHHESELFIGFGNPDSKILIIGKECALKDNDVNIISSFENKLRWSEYLNGKKDSITTLWSEVPRNQMSNYFNPSKPFYGQLKKICRGCRNNGGTSPTWYWYQRVIDALRDVENKNTDKLDFFDYCFITELSAISKPNSKSGDKLETIRSIKNRLELFKEPFFQSFPVVLAACQGYLRYLDVPIESLFPNSKVIITRQLSVNVSCEDLKIPELKQTMEEKNIHLSRTIN